MLLLRFAICFVKVHRKCISILFSVYQVSPSLELIWNSPKFGNFVMVFSMDFCSEFTLVFLNVLQQIILFQFS